MSRVPPVAAATPLVRAFSRELARAGGLLSPDYLASGMSLGEARCLWELGHSEGFEISALARCLDLDLGYVSRAVSRLADRGLVTKRVAVSDARARSVVITARGARQLAALERRANQRLGAWLAAKPRPAIDRLIGGLHALYGAGDDRVTIRAPRPGAMGHIIARHGEIYAGEFGYPAVFEHYVVQAFAEFVAGWAPPRDRIFVAERAGRFLGSIASKGLPDATAQLRFLIVEADARGLGLGRRLVRSVIDHCRRLGERRIVLDTASDLTAARALYTAHGFQLTARTTGEPFLPRGVASERWELDLSK
ncbi:MAG TPA: helix-turn-helix domain-containing GNAT family N-acetyltransferase [Kofleriaceae bacterium]|jgi:DNA-binding MarR family transcriptional regulator/ribosomal protein S18 acetylase RimI-like enzyme|nr:helix-turn-helix domain-containing GNAT family N-acetyltransferase [Kofleriaceae bacterium]